MNKYYTQVVVLVLVLLVFGASRFVPASEVDEITMKIEPVYAEFVQGQALEFLLVLNNLSAMPMQVKLGSDGIGNLRVTVTTNGGSQTAKGAIRSGISRLIVLEVPAHWSVSHRLFLDKFLRLNEPQIYKLSIEIMGTDIAPASTAFYIVPDTKSSRDLLKNRYSELRQKMRDPDVLPQDQNDARKALVLSRHSVALDIQEDILRKRSWQDNWEYEQLTDAMVSSQSLQGIQALVDSILATPDSSAFEKTVVFNQLRMARVEEWSIPAYELLLPYHKDIETSVPTVISD